MKREFISLLYRLRFVWLVQQWLSPNRRIQWLFGLRDWSLLCVRILTKQALMPVKERLSSKRGVAAEGGRQARSRSSSTSSSRVGPPEKIPSREIAHGRAQMLGFDLISDAFRVTAKLSCVLCRI